MFHKKNQYQQKRIVKVRYRTDEVDPHQLDLNFSIPENLSLNGHQICLSRYHFDHSVLKKNNFESIQDKDVVYFFKRKYDLTHFYLFMDNDTYYEPDIYELLTFLQNRYFISAHYSLIKDNMKDASFDLEIYDDSLERINTNIEFFRKHSNIFFSLFNLSIYKNINILKKRLKKYHATCINKYVLDKEEQIFSKIQNGELIHPLLFTETYNQNKFHHLRNNIPFLFQKLQLKYEEILNKVCIRENINIDDKFLLNSIKIDTSIFKNIDSIIAIQDYQIFVSELLTRQNKYSYIIDAIIQNMLDEISDPNGKYKEPIDEFLTNFFSKGHLFQVNLLVVSHKIMTYQLNKYLNNMLHRQSYIHFIQDPEAKDLYDEIFSYLQRDSIINNTDKVVSTNIENNSTKEEITPKRKRL